MNLTEDSHLPLWLSGNSRSSCQRDWANQRCEENIHTPQSTREILLLTRNWKHTESVNTWCNQHATETSGWIKFCVKSNFSVQQVYTHTPSFTCLLSLQTSLHVFLLLSAVPVINTWQLECFHLNDWLDAQVSLSGSTPSLSTLWLFQTLSGALRRDHLFSWCSLWSVKTAWEDMWLQTAAATERKRDWGIRSWAADVFVDQMSAELQVTHLSIKPATALPLLSVCWQRNDLYRPNFRVDPDCKHVHFCCKDQLFTWMCVVSAVSAHNL